MKLTVRNRTLTARLTCATFVDCSGSLSLFGRARSLTRAKRAASAKRAKPVVVGTSGFFFVPGKHARSVRVKLTRAGRALIRRGRPRSATLRLTAVGPTGHRTTASRTVTVVAQRAKKKRG